MIVYTLDVKDLMNKALEKFEKEKDIAFGVPSLQEFFKKFVSYINLKTKSDLSSDTFYKHYHIRLKTHNKSEIGYSVNYLNALSNFVLGKDYLDEFSRALVNDSEVPEFPPHHPCFPATPCVKIDYKDYTNIWIKDESHNPSGTHKDRMAHEIVLMYKRIITEQLERGEGFKIPRLSMISSGYAALAIQYRLRESGLPDLKVLVDENIPDELLSLIKQSEAEVYTTNLKKKRLSAVEILSLTDNVNGIELTHGEETQDLFDTYYDWLSYEVLNLNPNHLFIPYGSGVLFRNILEIHMKELKSSNNSKRYFGNRKILKDCNFYGARTQKKRFDSRMYCLVSFFDAIKVQDSAKLLNKNSVGENSGVYEILEDNTLIDSAMKIAKENKIKTCESGIAGLTLFLQNESKLNIPKDQKIVIINTGVIKPTITLKSVKKSK